MSVENSCVKSDSLKGNFSAKMTACSFGLSANFPTTDTVFSFGFNSSTLSTVKPSSGGRGWGVDEVPSSLVWLLKTEVNNSNQQTLSGVFHG